MFQRDFLHLFEKCPQRLSRTCETCGLFFATSSGTIPLNPGITGEMPRDLIAATIEIRKQLFHAVSGFQPCFLFLYTKPYLSLWRILFCNFESSFIQPCPKGAPHPLRLPILFQGRKAAPVKCALSSPSSVPPNLRNVSFHASSCPDEASTRLNPDSAIQSMCVSHSSHPHQAKL